MEEENKASLVWEDLSVVAKNRQRYSKLLLNGLTGYALPNRILAVMGPSGSGKSTLLDALSGRLCSNVTVTGNVWFNGRTTTTGCKNHVSYVKQEDHLLGTLTVRETLTYSARLRLPATMNIDDAVEEVILKMGLQDCAESKVGNWHLRGISGGEKRRLSISLEMLTQPQVMLFDEPTSGLDSNSAWFVVQALRGIALDGRIVVCSIHQPSGYVFDLFDDLCLLSNGHTIYFGESKLAIKLFADAGFPCPGRRNPPDHFLVCINSDFDKVASSLSMSRKNSVVTTTECSSSQVSLTTEEIKKILADSYRSFGYLEAVKGRVQHIIHSQVKKGESENTSNSYYKNNNKLKQFKSLTCRSFINMARDYGYYWLRILFGAGVCLGAGIMFFDVGLSNPAILQRIKCYTFVYDFLFSLCVGSLPSTIEEWKVINHEILNGHYPEIMFVVANMVSSLLFLVIISISCGSLVYYMVRFHMGFSHLAYLCINLFCCISIMETITMIVALLMPNFLMGIGVSSAVIFFVTISSGLYRPFPDLPKVFWRYPMTYITFSSWAVEGQLKNDCIGQEFDAQLPGNPKLDGGLVLKEFFGFNLNYSKWVDLAVLFVLLLCHRLLFYIILKYKGRAASILRKTLE